MDDELVDDPLVLGAALALVDEWYAGRRNAKPEPPEETVVAVGLRKRTRKELTWLRPTVQQLNHNSVSRSEELVKCHEDGEENDKFHEPIVREQARRVLHAVRSLNRLHTASSLSTSATQSFAIRSLDDPRVVNTIRSRLDSLARIARLNQPANALVGGNVGKQELTYTPNGFRMLSHSTLRLPFKLSVVAEGMWKWLKLVAYGPSHRDELSNQHPDDILVMLASTARTPSGTISNEGPAALRRVFEADGSVLLLHTVIDRAPPSSKQLLGEDSDPNTQSLDAGCTIRQAGWARLRLASSRPGRPLVIMEAVAAVAVEAAPGCSLSRDRQQHLLRVIDELSLAEPRRVQTLENLLMDMSLAKEKHVVSRNQ